MTVLARNFTFQIYRLEKPRCKGSHHTFGYVSFALCIFLIFIVGISFYSTRRKMTDMYNQFQRENLSFCSCVKLVALYEILLSPNQNLVYKYAFFSVCFRLYMIHVHTVCVLCSLQLFLFLLFFKVTSIKSRTLNFYCFIIAICSNSRMTYIMTLICFFSTIYLLSCLRHVKVLYNDRFTVC